MPYVIDEMYRLRMLMAGIYIGIGISSTYGFSLFTEVLKAKYGFDQSKITTITTTGNCVGYFCFFAGMLFDYAGPRFVFPLAGLFGFLGYLLFGLAFDDVIPTYSQNVNMIMFCIFGAILYLGCPSLDVACIMPLMTQFPRERGYIVIVQKTFSGMGTSIMMIYFNAWFRQTDAKGAVTIKSYSSYAYFIGVQLIVVAIVGTVFIDLPPYVITQYRRKRITEEELQERKDSLTIYLRQPSVKPRIYYACILVIVMLVFVTVSSITTGYVHTTKGGYIAISVICLFLLCSFSALAWPIQKLGRYPVIKKHHPKFYVLGIAEGDEEMRVKELNGEHADGDEQGVPVDKAVKATEGEEACAMAETSKLDEVEPLEELALNDDVLGLHKDGDGTDKAAGGKDSKDGKDGKDETVHKKSPVVMVAEPQYTGSFWRHLGTIDLWLLWLTFYGLWGTGTVMNMNAAQIYRSVNGSYNAQRQTLYVALIGVGSAVGRILSGVIDMQLTLARQRGKTQLQTTLFLPSGCVFLCLAYMCFSVVPANALILPFLLGSIGGGLGWGLGTLSVRIIYASDIGKHYNFMFTAGVVSTITLNRFMFGLMFDRQGRKFGTTPYCDHRICVRNQLLILMCVNVFCFCTGMIVHIRFSRFVLRQKRKQLSVDGAAVSAADYKHGHGELVDGEHAIMGRSEEQEKEEAHVAEDALQRQQQEQEGEGEQNAAPVTRAKRV